MSSMTQAELTELYGDPIYVYSDEQAVEDGVLVAVNGLFPAIWKLNRVTRAVWDAYTAPIGPSDLRITDVTVITRTLRATWEDADVVDGWRIGMTSDGRVVWFVPNETGGMTAMFPEDY